ncbi:hypothetical protein [Spirosoma aerophilum]
MLKTQYHIGDAVVYVDSQFKPRLGEVIDIDAQRQKDGIKTQFLLNNGRYYQASELFPNVAAAKAFYRKHFKDLLARFDETSLAAE